jgi:chromosome partitioning protein
MPKTIVFASEKGGVGKTTSAVNLAMALVIGGYRVLLVDMDPQGSVRFSFGSKTLPQAGTLELLTQPDVPLQKLVTSPDSTGLDAIYSNIETLNTQMHLDEKGTDPFILKRRLEKEADQYDFVVLDAPASTGTLAIASLSAGDLLILPLQCESLAIKSLKRFLVAFKDLQKNVNPQLRIAGILLTMYDRGMEVHRRICREVYDALYDAVFDTIIPKAREIPEASAVGQSVITYNINSVGATAYIRLAKEILDRFNLRPTLEQ